MNKILKNVRKNIYWIVVLILLSLAGVLNLVSWMSKDFCDAYVKYIFPLWGRIYGLFTGIFPFSVGEIMLYLAVILVILAIASAIWLLILCVLRKKKRIADILCIYLKIVVMIVAIEAVVMTLNCYMLYHCSTFEEKYMPGVKSDRQYSVKELADVREMIIKRADELAKAMPRDKQGNIIYDGNMADVAVEEMKRMGEQYSQLSGYYVRPKAFATSEFFSQQYMMGYYFPFSMEANYNDVMYIANIPATMCHELSHTKGFIYEDEASFIAYLACISSDDLFFEYSGYLSVLSYINNDLYESLGKDKELYRQYMQPSEPVVHDRVFLTKEAWDRVEKSAVIDTETVKRASDKFVETNLILNGVEQGSAVYCDVVDRVLDYYYADNN